MSTAEKNVQNWQHEMDELPKKENGLQFEEIMETKDEMLWTNMNFKEKFESISKQLLTAIGVSWVSLIVGYNSGYTSPADASLRSHFGIGDSETSWIGGLLPLGAMGGGLVGGSLIDTLGRKRSLLVTDLLFLIAWILNYFATTHYFLYVSRAIMGLGVGVGSLVFPVYLGETIQPEIRGALGILPTTFGNFGILTCFLVGIILEWKNLAGIGVLLSLPFLALIVWFIPDTPRWYLSKGRTSDCRESLQWLRGSKQNINKEFDELVEYQKIEDTNKVNASIVTTIKSLFIRRNLKPLVIVLSLMFFQQFSGINSVIFYTARIFKDSGSTLPPLICTSIIGVVNLVSIFLANVLIDKLGRKILLYISSISMVVTLICLGTHYYLTNISKMDLTDFGWIPLVCLIVYALGFSLGFGPIPWLMMGEILPAKTRGLSASIATSFNWSCAFVVTKSFPLLLKSAGGHTLFWMYGVVVLLGGVFTFLFVPETKGKSLAEIERQLSGNKVDKRKGNIQDMGPVVC